MSQIDDRYSRQVLLREIGEDGQRKLLASTVLIVGCGALGSNLATLTVRAGFGRVRIVDRDVLERSNLHRQVLFDEDDVAAGLPKAIAAARKLVRINSDVVVEPHVTDVTASRIEPLLEGVDVVLDGTDNFEIRYLINDACLEHGIPWVYAGVVATSGMSMTFTPGDGPCLRCLFPELPPPGSLPTCDTIGVLNTAPALLATLQATEAIKLVTDPKAVSRGLLHLDLWSRAFRVLEVARVDDCPACGQGRRDFLESRDTPWTTSLCGRNTVQISPARPVELQLDLLGARLAKAGEVRNNGFLLQFDAEGHTLVVFPDGRVLVQGTNDEALARTLHARYIGS